MRLFSVYNYCLFWTASLGFCPVTTHILFRLVESWWPGFMNRTVVPPPCDGWVSSNCMLVFVFFLAVLFPVFWVAMLFPLSLLIFVCSNRWSLTFLPPLAFKPHTWVVIWRGLGFMCPRCALRLVFLLVLVMRLFLFCNVSWGTAQSPMRKGLQDPYMYSRYIICFHSHRTTWPANSWPEERLISCAQYRWKNHRTKLQIYNWIFQPCWMAPEGHPHPNILWYLIISYPFNPHPIFIS